MPSSHLPARSRGAPPPALPPHPHEADLRREIDQLYRVLNLEATRHAQIIARGLDHVVAGPEDLSAEAFARVFRARWCETADLSVYVAPDSAELRRRVFSAIGSIAWKARRKFRRARKVVGLFAAYFTYRVSVPQHDWQRTEYDAELKSALAQMEHLLEYLGPKTRLAARLVCWQHMTYAEAAAETGTSPETIRDQVNTAIQQLADMAEGRRPLKVRKAKSREVKSGKPASHLTPGGRPAQHPLLPPPQHPQLPSPEPRPDR